MPQSKMLERVATYYSDKLRQYGATPAGVDWRDPPAQLLRFEQFDGLIAGQDDSSIVDYGCGYGEYLSYLRSRGFKGLYCGIDVSAAMIEAARLRFGDDPKATFIVGYRPDVVYDYAVASGIFNVRLDVTIPEWERYIASTIASMTNAARKGIAFNCITNKATIRKDRLYYGDPKQWRRHCAGLVNGDAELRENYGLYDFTVIVRKDGPGEATSRQCP